MIIAVDGPTAAGKGTLARTLAKTFGFAYLDSGLLYRAVASRLLAAGGIPEDQAAARAVAESLTTEDLRRPELRDEAVSQLASQVAALAPVRQALLTFQRDFAGDPPDGRAGAVLDGRDIGTAICPQAEIKFFVTASPEARAERRHKELLARGEKSIYARVLADLQQRDARDRAREASPLRAAEDAINLDSTGLSADQVFTIAMGEILKRFPDLTPATG